MYIIPSTTIRQRQMEARIKLQSKLAVAEKQIAEGAELLDHDQVMARMRMKIKAANKRFGRLSK